MKLRNDFYFWSSWILLGCLILLVFYMYQKEFNLENFIDLKTILLVLGTVFGAYFGAKVAGQYAVSSVQKQIDFNKDEAEHKTKRVLEKKLNETAVRCRALHGYFIGIQLAYESVEEESKRLKDASTLNEIESFLKEEIMALKNIDLTEVYGRPYFVINSLHHDLDFILESIKSMADNTTKGHDHAYLFAKRSLSDSILGFEESLKNLDGEIERNN